MALIGFDGGELYNIVSPSITQLVQQTSTTARLSFDMLCRMMPNYPDGEEGTYVIIEPELIEGESSKGI